MTLLNDLATQPIGNIALRAGAITPEQRDLALKVQERAIALHGAMGEQKATEYFKNPQNLRALQTEEGWNKAKAEFSVTAAHEAAAHTTMEQRKGAPAGVPPLGQVVTGLGMVPAEIMQPLLAAQAGARVFHMIDEVRAEKPLSPVPEPRMTDPADLRQAQQLAKDAYWKAHEIAGEMEAARLSNMKTDNNPGYSAYMEQARGDAVNYERDLFPQAGGVIKQAATALQVEGIKRNNPALGKFADTMVQEAKGPVQNAPEPPVLGDLTPSAPGRSPAPAGGQRPAP